MKDEKNIDNNIREKLEGFHVSPPPHIWGNVQDQLAGIRRRNRLVYMGWISAAAVIILAFLAGWYFNENVITEKSASVTEEIIQNNEKREEALTQPTEIATLERTPVNNAEDEINKLETGQFVASYKSSDEVAENLKASKATYTSRENFSLVKLESAEVRVVQNQPPNVELAKRFEPVSETTFNEQEQLLVAENIKNFEVTEKSENNWKMGMFVAPGYSSFNANHAETYAQNMTYSGNSGNTNVGGGVSVQYKPKKRWIVESGLYYAQSGQESESQVNFLAKNREEDLMFAPGNIPNISSNVRVENDNLAMNSTAGIIEFKSTPTGAALNGEFDAIDSKEVSIYIPDGQYSQVFDFMEIPLYVRYRVVDRKVGVELITGLNAGIVVGNNAYINNQYGLQNIGETKDISTVNLSGTLGLGLNYALGKHVSVALEPRYNYYLNSINTNSSVDFRPYRIGFYTGVTYEF